MDISHIDLQTLDKEQLDRVKLMLDINKIQADIQSTQQGIEESKARSRQADATLEQIRVTVAKIEKENQWFPWLQMLTTFLTGGVVVFILTKLLQ